MAYLPLSNLMHHKLRSLLSAFGIGIGICMLVTLSGLARGSLFEVADRWESVDADLIVLPRGWGNKSADRSGAALFDRYADVIAARHGAEVQRVVPVFLSQMELAGQPQMVAGVDPDQWHTLTGRRPLQQGRLFDPQGRFATWIEGELLTPAAEDEDDAEPLELDLAKADSDGLEIVIDTRLARAGGYRLGQKVFAANHHWTIVGIVPAGAMTRVFMLRRTAQYLFGDGLSRSTLMFVKLRGGLDVGPAGRAIGATIRQDVIPLADYRGNLMETFGVMFVYVDVVNGIALVIAFLFIMTTLHTMVLQQRREIAILKANGASNAFILRQVLGESFLMTAAGVAIGIGLSVLAAWLIETYWPLLTVTITWRWIAIAIAASAAGAVVSALYPAWRATRVDIVAALSFE